MVQKRLTAESISPARDERRQKLRCTIAATGAAVPATTVSNETLISNHNLETTDEWIREKTGIAERRFASDHEGVVSLATAAALQALENAKVAPDEIDIVVVATCSSETVIPSAAAAVQGNLLATNAVAWDINSACSGFSFAFDTVLRYLQTTGRYGLVIGADCGSRLVDPTDRLTSVFFGDGAAAVLVDSAESRTAGKQGNVLASHLETAGTSDPLSLESGGCMTMDGKAVWKYATSTLPRIVRLLCDSAGCQVFELDAVVAHQANTNILSHAADRLGLPIDKFPRNIDRYGNTLAASIPLALHDALRPWASDDNDRLVAIVGFGGGLAAGGHLLRMKSSHFWSDN